MPRYLGHARAGVGYEIERRCGGIVRVPLVAIDRGYSISIAPALLAVKKIVADDLPRCGLGPPDHQLDPQDLIKYLHRFGIKFNIENGVI